MASWVWTSIHTKGGITYETYVALPRSTRGVLHSELNRHIDRENERLEKASRR